MRLTLAVTGLRMVALAGAGLALAGCTSTSSSGEGGSLLSNMLLYGGTTKPPVAGTPALEVADCPVVDVGEGGAAIRSVAGKSSDAGAVRSQISIAHVARECIARPDGSVGVKVGVEGRALAGPGGSVGRTEVPVYFILKRGDRVLAARSRRVPVKLDPDGTSGSFIVVEDQLAAPPGVGTEFEIETGLGNPPAVGAATKPARSRRASR